MLVEDERGRLQVLKLITEVGGDGPALAEVLEHVRAQLPAHPGLSPVTDVRVADEGVGLASPLIEATSVEARLRGGRQTLDATLPWLRTVVAGLQTAHAAGVWHGAIHPRDVLVGDEGGVLTGVGIAPALEHLSMQAPVRVPYTAPERASGRPWDARADQYSLAMLALDALSGRRLIAGTIPAFDRWTLAETPTEDARLHEVFVRALHPDPDERYGSLDQWLAALAGPEREASHGALSRFAREGVILATPAAAADGARDIEVQHLEDPDGVALSLFPEEDGLSDEPTGTAPAPVVAEAPDDLEEPEQEWLVADVPQEVAAAEPAPDPEPLVYRTPPTEHPTIDAPSVGPAPSAEWRLDDEEATVVVAEPPRSWDVPAEESSTRGPLLLAVVVLVLAALGYGTWRSLQTPAAPAAGEVAGATEEPASGGSTEQPADQTSAAPALPAAPAVPEGGEGVVPQAPIPAPQGQSTAPARPAAPAAPPAARAEAPEQEAPAATSGTGRALIRSSPSGEVRVNGRSRGETPVVLRDLPFGSYVVSISRPGFQTVEREVTLLASQPVASITVDLARGEGTAPAPPAPPAAPVATPTAPAGPPPAPGAGTSTPTPPVASGPARAGQSGGIFVVSTPAAGRLYVDGQSYGSTPAAVPGLSPGAHTVRVEARGYRPWEGRIEVVPGTRVRVQATLQQEQE